MHLYSVLTKNCNYSCRHCHVSAGPGNEESTMSVSNFRKVVGNLEGTVDDITLSGGELFTMEDHLFGYLDVINEYNKKKNKVWITLQTNGSWAKNTEKMEETIEKLKKYVIQRIDIASKDKFHKEQGQPNIFKKLIGNLQENNFSPMVAGTVDDRPMPVGRAIESMGYELSYYCGQPCRVPLETATVTMNWKGELSLCCFGFFRLEGNLIEEPLLEIIERNKRRTIIKKIRNGIAEVAKYNGMPAEEAQALTEKYGEGGFCSYLFRKEYIKGGRIFD